MKAHKPVKVRLVRNRIRFEEHLFFDHDGPFPGVKAVRTKATKLPVTLSDAEAIEATRLKYPGIEIEVKGD